MNTSSITTRNANINIIFDLARAKGQEIKTIEQYHSASQSLSMQGKLKIDMSKYKDEDKHKYRTHFIQHKCGSC